MDKQPRLGSATSALLFPCCVCLRAPPASQTPCVLCFSGPISGPRCPRARSTHLPAQHLYLTIYGHQGTHPLKCIPLIATAAAKSLQSCPTVRPHRRQPTRLPHPRDSPGKNTGVGCHFLLQCMKVKSESEVAQLCPTLSDSMDCSLPGSSVHGMFQARVLECGTIAFSPFPLRGQKRGMTLN